MDVGSGNAVGEDIGGADNDTVVGAVVEVVGRHSKLIVVDSGDVIVTFEDDLTPSVHDSSGVNQGELTVGRTMGKVEEIRAHPRQSSPLVSVVVA